MKLSHQNRQKLEHGHLCCERDQFVIIKASGPTIVDYLQGQITQDIQKLTTFQGIYTAILSPQGRIISDLHIISGHNNELMIIAQQDSAETLVARLRQFALGHQVRIGIVDSLKLVSVQGEQVDAFLKDYQLPIPAKNHLATATVDNKELSVIRMAEAADDGIWIVTDDAGSLIEENASVVGEQVIHAARIIKGIPTYGIDWNEKILPLNANLIEFDGVSFEKGCYVGQEVTSRMQWRGGIKKRLYRVQLESFPQTLPCPISTTVQIGTITSVAIDADALLFGIAHLPIEIVESQTPLIDPEGDSVQVIEACYI